jgi:hypothetical protein
MTWYANCVDWWLIDCLSKGEARGVYLHKAPTFGGGYILTPERGFRAGYWITPEHVAGFRAGYWITPEHVAAFPTPVLDIPTLEQL